MSRSTTPRSPGKPRDLGRVERRYTRQPLLAIMATCHGLFLGICLLVFAYGESTPQVLFYVVIGLFASWAGYRAVTLAVLTVRTDGIVVRDAWRAHPIPWRDIAVVSLDEHENDATMKGRLIAVHLDDGTELRAGGFWETARAHRKPGGSTLGRIVADLEATRVARS